jgi:hypothetical protein
LFINRYWLVYFYGLIILKAGYFLNFEVKNELLLPISGLISYYPGPKDSFLEFKSLIFHLKVIDQSKSVDNL